MDQFSTEKLWHSSNVMGFDVDAELHYRTPMKPVKPLFICLLPMQRTLAGNMPHFSYAASFFFILCKEECGLWHAHLHLYAPPTPLLHFLSSCFIWLVPSYQPACHFSPICDTDMLICGHFSNGKAMPSWDLSLLLIKYDSICVTVLPISRYRLPPGGSPAHTMFIVRWFTGSSKGLLTYLTCADHLKWFHWSRLDGKQW